MGTGCLPGAPGKYRKGFLLPLLASGWKVPPGKYPLPGCNLLFVHALISSVLPYALFSLSMRYMETGKASILASSEPAAAMIFGAVLYSETPSLLSVLGLCFTIAAVVLLNVPEKNVK